jgi:predicted DNA-binding protein (MmcQ/YjbR family)
MNKKHWNTIVMDGSIGDKLIQQWIDLSYDLVAASLPKKERAALKDL